MKVKLLSPGAKVPTRAEKGAAGYDLYVPCNFVINPGRNLIKLDISIELKFETQAQISPRSGFSLKGIEGYLLEDMDTPKRFDADVIIGTIDESYRGVVGVIIKSYESIPFIVKEGTKIAQMVISHYCNEPFEVVTELSKTERGEGGFGHTGTK